MARLGTPRSNMADENETTQQQEETDGDTARKVWVVVRPSGELATVGADVTNERHDLETLLGGTYAAVGGSIGGVKCAFATKLSLLEKHGGENAVASRACGVTLYGTVVIGLRSGTGSSLTMKIRRSWKYLTPFNRNEAAIVVATLKQ